MDFTRTTGLMSVYYRTLFTYLEDEEFESASHLATAHIRDCIEMAGGHLTASYNSQLRMLLRTAGYIQSTRNDHTWWIHATPKGIQHWYATRDLDWGHELNPEVEDVAGCRTILETDVAEMPQSIVRYGHKNFRSAMWQLWRNGHIDLYMVPGGTRMSRVKGNDEKFVFTLPD